MILYLCSAIRFNPHKNIKTMEKIFKQRTAMETQTIFHENGRVSILPLHEGTSLTGDEGAQVVQRGRMITDDNGRSIFHPYQVTGMPRYHLLLSTDHGDVKKTPSGNMVVTIRLPQNADMAATLIREAKEMAKRLESH